jgi:hypothetical protein
MNDINDEDWGEYAPQLRQLMAEQNGADDYRRKRFEAARRSFETGLEAASSIIRPYLEISRGIPWVEGITDLRFCNNFYHSKAVGAWPTMLGAMRLHPEGDIVAIHATFLHPDGSGKAEVDPPRKVYGKARSAAVWLTPHADTMVLAESIEKALAVRAATGAAVISGYSQANLSKIDPPPSVTTWVIAADRGEAAENFARKAGRRLLEEVKHEAA